MQHDPFMRQALKEALKAYAKGEVPVGAVVVHSGEIIGRGHNLRETSQDPTTHAEIIAIREAARNTGSWRLEGCDLYVTLEPCLMCAGAISLSRIRKVFFGASDPKAGAIVTCVRAFDFEWLNHIPDFESGLSETTSSALLSRFFEHLRRRKKLLTAD
ncbi:MAG TPA: nucleoside deaminase [Firmicutes bacterium]|nr:nucleoside deaminase [Bacillota bacterium]